MNYEIKMSPELKTGNKFVLGTQRYLASSDYMQCLGAGHFDFGEYGMIEVLPLTKCPDVKKEIDTIWLYKNLPVILITD